MDRSSGLHNKYKTILRQAVNDLAAESRVHVVKLERKHKDLAMELVANTEDFLKFNTYKNYMEAIFLSKNSADAFRARILTVEAVEIDVTPMREDDLKKFFKTLGANVLHSKTGKTSTRVYLDVLPKALLFAPSFTIPCTLTNHNSEGISFEWVLRRNCSKCGGVGHEEPRCNLNSLEIETLKMLNKQKQVATKDYTNLKLPKKRLRGVNRESNSQNMNMEVPRTPQLANAHPQSKQWRRTGKVISNVTYAQVASGLATQLLDSLQHTSIPQTSHPPVVEQGIVEGKLEVDDTPMIDRPTSDVSLPAQTGGLPTKQSDVESPSKVSNIKRSEQSLKTPSKPTVLELRLPKQSKAFAADMIDDIVAQGNTSYYHVKWTGHDSLEDDGQFYAKSSFPDIETLVLLLNEGIKAGLSVEKIKDKKILTAWRERFPSTLK